MAEHKKTPKYNYEIKRNENKPQEFTGNCERKTGKLQFGGGGEAPREE